MNLQTHGLNERMATLPDKSAYNVYDDVIHCEGKRLITYPLSLVLNSCTCVITLKELHCPTGVVAGGLSMRLHVYVHVLCSTHLVYVPYWYVHCLCALTVDRRQTNESDS